MATVNTPLIVIVGETASGKTSLAIELALKFNGEIICADSRTIYRGLDIATAKPTKDEQSKVPHHLIDICEPTELYSAAQFQLDAQAAINDITLRNKLPIIVGGSGLYINALIYDYAFPVKLARSVKNPRHALGASMDTQLRKNTLLLGLHFEKDELASRIRTRVNDMLQDGILDEAKRLTNKYGYENEALKGAGYYFFSDYTNGMSTLDEAVDKFVRSHMLLAKKQRTWFKRNKSIHWLNNGGSAVDLTTTFLNNLSV